MITTDRAELEAMLSELQSVAETAERGVIPAGSEDPEPDIT
jgi:hypothetical protein